MGKSPTEEVRAVSKGSGGVGENEGGDDYGVGQ